MAGPYKCVDMLIKIDDAIVGVVEGFDIDLSYEGGVEHHYGSREGRHSRGGKKATFSIRRWYMSDEDADLLWDLFDSGLAFTLSGELIDENDEVIPNTKISLSNAKIYRWRPRTGGANDTIAEEASGEATSWSSEI